MCRLPDSLIIPKVLAHVKYYIKKKHNGRNNVFMSYLNQQSPPTKMYSSSSKNKKEDFTQYKYRQLNIRWIYSC